MNELSDSGINCVNCILDSEQIQQKLRLIGTFNSFVIPKKIIFLLKKYFNCNLTVSDQSGSWSFFMSIGRNAPCPCGSGKKYKKCCYLKPGNNINQQNSPTDKPAGLNRLAVQQSSTSLNVSHEKSSTKSTNDFSGEEKISNNTNEKIMLLDKETAMETISKLELDDLRFLNKIIVDRIKLLVNCRQSIEMSKFYPGCRVKFTSSAGEIKNGTVIRINKKTVSVEADGEAGYWKVSPQLLLKL